MAYSRREFLEWSGVMGAAAFAAPLYVSAAEASRREPVKYEKGLEQPAFLLLPLGAVRPTGWLRRQLEVQAQGLSGHLDETWPDVGPESGWLGGKGESWERGPYFLDGLLPMAYLLEDRRLKEK